MFGVIAICVLGVLHFGAGWDFPRWFWSVAIVLATADLLGVANTKLEFLKKRKS